MKYAECNYCGKKIKFGNQVMTHCLFCGIYCSDRCFLKAKVPDWRVCTLTPDIIDEYEVEVKEL